MPRRARRHPCLRRSRGCGREARGAQRASAAIEKPQLPATTVVTPWKHDGVSAGPRNLRVVVGVDVDEPGRDDAVAGVEHVVALEVRTDLGDAAPEIPDVSAHARRAGAVVHGPALDPRSRSPSLLPLRRCASGQRRSGLDRGTRYLTPMAGVGMNGSGFLSMRPRDTQLRCPPTPASVEHDQGASAARRRRSWRRCGRSRATAAATRTRAPRRRRWRERRDHEGAAGARRATSTASRGS